MMRVHSNVAVSVSEQTRRILQSTRSRSLLHRMVFAAMLLGAFESFSADLKWSSSFSETYLSEADGNRIPFRIKTPPRDEGGQAYPLLVALKGSLRVNPGRRFPFFEVRPSRGNVWGYRAISTYDVIQVIAYMKRKYPVDPDRIYLVGSSAGASGAMHLASLHPDQFAGVIGLVAAGNNYPVSNFLNLPVAFHHGAKDWTSAICDARVQYQKMKDFGCPVVLREYPNAGHSIPRPHEPIMEWLFAQKRNLSPDRVTRWCESPRFGRSYWMEIGEFADPHRPALVDARIDRDTRELRVVVENAVALTIHRQQLPAMFNRIRIGRQTIPVPAGVESVVVVANGNRWRSGSRSLPARRPYVAGATANLLQGEPLLVVYGRGHAAAARKMAGCGGPDYGSLRQRFPVVADVDLTHEQCEKHNLILVGTPGENAITKRLLPHLPIEIVDGRLNVGGRPPLTLKGRVLSLLHPNPESPKRLVYLVMPFAKGPQFAEVAQRFLVGSDGFERGSQGDLVVHDLQQRIVRQMQFGKDWKWQPSGSETPLPETFRDRSDFARSYMKAMCRESKADFALWWGPEDKGMWGADFNFLKQYDPKHCTRADLTIERRQVETILGSVSGAELKQIWLRWGTKRGLIALPDLKLGELDDEMSYQLNIPIDLYIKLGQRRKNLGSPVPGPTVATEAVVAEMFGDK